MINMSHMNTKSIPSNLFYYSKDICLTKLTGAFGAGQFCIIITLVTSPLISTIFSRYRLTMMSPVLSSQLNPSYFFVEHFN